MTQAKLLAEIEAFLIRRRMAQSTFGRLAVNDGKFVGRLRNRENMTIQTMERAMDYLARENRREPA